MHGHVLAFNEVWIQKLVLMVGLSDGVQSLREVKGGDDERRGSTPNKVKLNLSFLSRTVGSTCDQENWAGLGRRSRIIQPGDEKTASPPPPISTESTTRTTLSYKSQVFAYPNGDVGGLTWATSVPYASTFRILEPLSA